MMKRIVLLVAMFLLLTAWRNGNSGVVVNLTDNSDVILTTGAGVNLIE